MEEREPDEGRAGADGGHGVELRGHHLIDRSDDDGGGEPVHRPAGRPRG
jgi:hypothetical protein